MRAFLFAIAAAVICAGQALPPKTSPADPVALVKALGECRDANPSNFEAACAAQIAAAKAAVSAFQMKRPQTFEDVEALFQQLADGPAKDFAMLYAAIYFHVPVGEWLPTLVGRYLAQARTAAPLAIKDDFDPREWTAAEFDQLTSFQITSLDTHFQTTVEGAYEMGSVVGGELGSRDGWNMGVAACRSALIPLLRTQAPPPPVPAPCTPTYTISPSLNGWQTITPIGCG